MFFEGFFMNKEREGLNAFDIKQQLFGKKKRKRLSFFNFYIPKSSSTIFINFDAVCKIRTVMSLFSHVFQSYCTFFLKIIDIVLNDKIALYF